MFSLAQNLEKVDEGGFNTPILLLGFNRPGKIQRVFDATAKLKPKRLYIALDGPRSSVPSDEAKCDAVKRIFENVDWECSLKILNRPANLGCKRAIESGISWFFEEVDQGIILEDDCLPDNSFFGYCELLLERYRDDERLMCVSGNNFNSCCIRSSHSYYFSKYMHCWGWATWRRAWQQHDAELTAFSRNDDESVIGSYDVSAAEMRYWRRRFDQVRSGRINSWDYGWQRTIWQQHGLVACPRVNLVENIGHGIDATHTTKCRDSATPKANRLLIESHPPAIEQDVLMDAHEASHVYRFGQKTFWSRCSNEWSSFYQKLRLPRLISDAMGSLSRIGA